MKLIISLLNIKMMKVQIEESELKRLIARNMLLSSLEDGGVDNWVGWDDAVFPDADGPEVQEEFDRLTKEE